MTDTATRMTVGPLGDQGIVLALDGDRERSNRRIARLAEALVLDLRGDASRAIVDVVPALVSLAVFFDARLITATAVERRLIEMAGRVPDVAADETAGRLHLIPVVYDGPDLAEVASRLGLPPDDVVRRHAERVYRVRFLGFAPGFAYLGPLDRSLVVARRADPRPRVPAGSVAVSGDQTAIYPLDTPGGWHLLGRTAVRPFDLSRVPASLFAPGDRVRFEPVT
jgi:KipI family sensor histidine kinase inhibitor